jgi:hypothetical protein
MVRMALYFFLTLLLILPAILFAQQAALSGKVTDKSDGSELIGVTIMITGTRFGTVTDEFGRYTINLPSGTYTINVSYIGYESTMYTGIVLKEGEHKTMNISMNATMVTIDQEIVIVGDKPLIDVEESKSSSQISRELIAAAPTRAIQGLLNTQTGVVLNPEGIHIRGGRTYETGFYIDDVSATDPLAGTGFGIDIGTNAIDNIEISTSTPGVEYGDATSGIVNTKTRTGGDQFAFSLALKRDNFGFNSDANSSFNQSTYETSAGGPVKFNKDFPAKFHYLASFKFNFTDTYIKQPASQLTSSLYPNSFWTPYQDNRWAGMLKLNYNFSPTKKTDFLLPAFCNRQPGLQYVAHYRK